MASSIPGQGGMVTATASSGPSPVARNWNAVPAEIAIETPADTATVPTLPVFRRHMRPLPDKKYQTSSTLR
jgi:hypothetical protein